MTLNQYVDGNAVDGEALDGMRWMFSIQVWIVIDNYLCRYLWLPSSLIIIDLLSVLCINAPASSP